eukprot:53258_1
MRMFGMENLIFDMDHRTWIIANEMGNQSTDLLLIASKTLEFMQITVRIGALRFEIFNYHLQLNHFPKLQLYLNGNHRWVQSSGIYQNNAQSVRVQIIYIQTRLHQYFTYFDIVSGVS